MLLALCISSNQKKKSCGSCILLLLQWWLMFVQSFKKILNGFGLSEEIRIGTWQHFLLHLKGCYLEKQHHYCICILHLSDAALHLCKALLKNLLWLWLLQETHICEDIAQKTFMTIQGLVTQQLSTTEWKFCISAHPIYLHICEVSQTH